MTLVSFFPNHPHWVALTNRRPSMWSPTLLTRLRGMFLLILENACEKVGYFFCVSHRAAAPKGSKEKETNPFVANLSLSYLPNSRQERIEKRKNDPHQIPNVFGSEESFSLCLLLIALQPETTIIYEGDR